MKTRLKNKAEKQYDADEISKEASAFVKVASEFADEFTECGGDVYFATYQKFTSAKWSHDHAIEVSKMRQVGDMWDHDNGVTGIYRYHDLVN